MSRHRRPARPPARALVNLAGAAVALAACWIGACAPRYQPGAAAGSDSAGAGPAAETSQPDAAVSADGAADSDLARADAGTGRPGASIEDPEGHALDPFYEALAVVDGSQVPGLLARVSFFGDSHTAADLMTGQLRRRLQERFGDGGHGFIAAGRPWPSYRHLDVRSGASGAWDTLQACTSAQAQEFDGRVGFAGVCIETERPGSAVWVATAEEGSFGLTASRFEIYYLVQPGGGRFTVRLDDELVARLSTRAPEPTPSTFVVETDDSPHQLDLQAAGRGRVRLFGTVVEREGPGVVVDSLGLNGARITSMLAWDQEAFIESLERRGTDLVVLWYGANSVGDQGLSLEGHEGAILEALTLVRRASADSACLLVGPPDMTRASLSWQGPLGTPEALPDLVAVQRDAAARFGCGFFDTLEAMGGQGSAMRWASHDPPLLSGDGIHFTRQGYEALADLLYDALIEGYERSLGAEQCAASPGAG